MDAPARRYQMPPPDYADPNVYIVGATLLFVGHTSIQPDEQVNSRFHPGDILTVDTSCPHEADGILVYGERGSDQVWPDEVKFLHDVWAFNPTRPEPLAL